MDEKKLLSLPFVIEKSPYARDSNPWFYEAIFMSAEVDPTFRLRESVTEMCIRDRVHLPPAHLGRAAPRLL